jgi:hypothetical protein
MNKGDRSPSLSREKGSAYRLIVWMDFYRILSGLLQVANETGSIFAGQMLKLQTICFEGHLPEFLD